METLTNYIKELDNTIIEMVKHSDYLLDTNDFIGSGVLKEKIKSISNISNDLKELCKDKT